MKTFSQIISESRMSSVARVDHHLKTARQLEDENRHDDADHHFRLAHQHSCKLTDKQKSNMKEKYGIRLNPSHG